MMILKWTLIILHLIATVGTVAMIGEPRKPLTNGTAAFVVLFNIILMWYLYSTRA